MIHNYSVEAYNIETNRWVVQDTARTLDEAFDKAEKYVGFHKSYDTVAILDMQGNLVWDSEHHFPKRESHSDQAIEQQQLVDENFESWVAPDGSV